MAVEKMDEKATDWTSIYIASLMAFCAAVQFGLYFTSMWPFLENVDDGVTEQFFAVVVAAYSLAQCIASPIFGYWSNKIKEVKTPMYLGLGSMIVGNIMYFSIEVFPSNRRYVMLVARFLMGVGSANLPLLRAYASTSCVAKDRAMALTYIGGSISLGTTIAPGLQLLFTPFGYPGFDLFGGLGINMYTAPAYTACLVCIICAVLMTTSFKETYAGIVESDKNSDEKVKIPKFDKVAASVCNLTRFTQQLFFINLELISSPIAMTVFAFTRQQTVEYGSMSQVALGIISLFIFFVYIIFKVSQRIKHRIAIVASLALLFAFHLVTYPWPFISGSLTTYRDQDLANATTEMVGCNVDRFDWCYSMKPINYWIFYGAFAVCAGLAMANIEVSSSTVYGRILGPRRQGTMQGVFYFTGGVARIVGPIIVGALYTNYGPQSIWLFGMGAIGLTIFSWALFYKRMVELKVDVQQDTESEETTTSCAQSV